MNELLSLSSNPSSRPVLLLDASRPYLDLQDSAEQRLSAVRGLMLSLTCMNIGLADAKDVQNLVEAAYLLLEDASDLFKAARTAAVREGCKYA